MPNRNENSTAEPKINVARSSLNLRIKPEDKILIDRASAAVGKNRTEFVLEAARKAAEETLADLRIISVAPEVYQQFVEQLDMSPKSNGALQKTMQTRSPWEK